MHCINYTSFEAVKFVCCVSLLSLLPKKGTSSAFYMHKIAIQMLVGPLLQKAVERKGSHSCEGANCFWTPLILCQPKSGLSSAGNFIVCGFVLFSSCC